MRDPVPQLWRANRLADDPFSDFHLKLVASPFALWEKGWGRGTQLMTEEAVRSLPSLSQKGEGEKPAGDGQKNNKWKMICSCSVITGLRASRRPLRSVL